MIRRRSSGSSSRRGFTTARAGRTQGHARRSTSGAAALSRSRLYLLLAAAFAFPEPAFHRRVVDGRFRQELGEAVRRLPYRLAAGQAQDWRPVRDYEAFLAEFIRLFQVGLRGHALCSLHSGHYGRDRVRTMEGLFRFYHYFGLNVSPGLMPDHVTAELEFMHHLTRHQSRSARAAGGADSLVRAQRDFLDQHLIGWWGQALDAAAGERPQRYYRSLMNFVHHFLAAERSYVLSVLRGD